jgi:hypothetical protein
VESKELTIEVKARKKRKRFNHRAIAADYFQGKPYAFIKKKYKCESKTICYAVKKYGELNRNRRPGAFENAIINVLKSSPSSAFQIQKKTGIHRSNIRRFLINNKYPFKLEGEIKVFSLKRSQYP